MQGVGKTVKTVLFSGRFDRPNVGHIVTIMRLGQSYDKVLVVVLDYDGQEYSAQYRANVLTEALKHAKGKYVVVVNNEHFAEITEEDLSAYEFDVYASGNHDCLKHIESLGRKVQYVERAFDYNSTDGRVINKIMKIL